MDCGPGFSAQGATEDAELERNGAGARAPPFSGLRTASGSSVVVWDIMLTSLVCLFKGPQSQSSGWTRSRDAGLDGGDAKPVSATQRLRVAQ